MSIGNCVRCGALNPATITTSGCSSCPAPSPVHFGDLEPAVYVLTAEESARLDVLLETTAPTPALLAAMRGAR